jgi:hypothetical protein
LIARLYEEDSDAIEQFVRLELYGDTSVPNDPVLPLEIDVEEGTDGIVVKLELGNDPGALTANITVSELQAAVRETSTCAKLLFGELFNQDLDSLPSYSADQIYESISVQEIQTYGEDTAWTKDMGEVLKTLQNLNHTAIIGASASGKTVTASRVATNLIDFGWGITWMDYSNPDANIVDFLRSLLRAPQPTSANQLVVIDNVQSNPGSFELLAQILRTLEGIPDGNVTSLLIGWPTIQKTIKNEFPSITVHQLNPTDTVRPIANKVSGTELSNDVISEIQDITRGDLFVTEIVADYYSEHGNLPQRQDIAEQIFDETTHGIDLTRNHLELLYRVSAIGQFEIGIRKSYAKARHDDAIDVLLDAGVLRRSGDFLSIGHRTECRLIVEHISRNHSAVVSDVGEPVELATSYLRAAGGQQIRTALERLDLARLQFADSEDQTSFLARAWQSLQLLMNHLSRQVSEDPTWDENISSAIFTAIAFARLSDDKWSEPAEFVRNRWDVSDPDSLPEPTEAVTSERIDFDKIQERMREEDENKSDKEIRYPADKIDLDRAHRTWVLGLLLGFETAALDKDTERLTKMQKIAESSISPAGWFYPPRVPWITARVLIGLTETGESYSTSETVRQACDWLRHPQPQGAFDSDLGAWPSGSGSWNTNVMTTAMCVNALVGAGVPTDDPAIESGIQYIRNNRDIWTADGNEIDAVLVIEALQNYGVEWHELFTEVERLLEWVQETDEWINAKTTDEDIQDESSKIPFISNFLISFIWEQMQEELPRLLEGIVAGVGPESVTNPEIPHTDDNINVLKQHLDDIEKTIEQQIQERRTSMGGGERPNIEENLELWKDRRDELRQIEQQLDTGSTSLKQVVKQVDDLGSICIPDWDSVLEKLKKENHTE